MARSSVPTVVATSIGLGASSIVVAEANGNRRRVELVNNGPAVVNIAYGATAVAGGCRPLASGAALDLDGYSGPVEAVTTTSTALLYRAEFGT